MSYFDSMRLTAKIYLLAAVLLLGLLLGSIFSYIAIRELQSLDAKYVQKVYRGLEFSGHLHEPVFGPWTIQRISSLMIEAVGNEDQKDIPIYYEQVQAYKQRYRENLELYKKTLADTDVKRTLIGPFDKVMQSLMTTWETQFWPSIQAGNKEAALAVLKGPMKPLIAESLQINGHISELQDQVQAGRKADMERETLAASEAGDASFWISTAIILTGLALAILIARSIHATLKKISEGIGQVSHEINSEIDSQGESVSQLSTSVHETTTSMDELNASFQHTQALASESNSRAENALKQSEEGNALIRLMLEGLTFHKEKVLSIVEQIARLSEITHQIHNVAAATSNLTNQTNILALNAAVQSAHVKQQTEGFSVIASEIRKLADESKKFLSHIGVLTEQIKHATDSTRSMAEEGSKTVQEGIKQAQTASKAFESIMSTIGATRESAQQVVLNVKEQGGAVQQVLGAMEIVNKVSQETVEGMNQVKAELDRLEDFSKTLKALI